MPHNTARGFTSALREPDLAGDAVVPPVVEEVRSPSPPPLTGKGSGRPVWADYAELVGVDPLGLSKAELVELVG